jgi:glycosyltransferase involved in cell wall biosynthesis
MFDAAYPPPIGGGKEKQVHLLANELKRQGVDVSALSYEHNGNHTQSHDNITVYRVKNGAMAPLLFLMRLIYLRVNFKILHIHTPSRIGHIMAFMGFMLGYRVVFLFPGERTIDNVSGSAIYYWRITIRLAKLLVVLEEKTQNTLISSWKVDKAKIFLASNGVEVLKNKKQIAGKTIKLLFVGRLVKLKRCSDLIKACSNLNNRNIKWQLDIVGNGPLMDSLQIMTKQLGTVDKINFHGYQSDVLKYMKDADVLVLPSETEGMSNALLEAMAIGLPIICTDVGAAKNMIGKQGEKYLIKPYDIIALSNKITIFAENPTLLKEYGAYLFERCKRKYSIQSIANIYIERYQKMELH